MIDTQINTFLLPAMFNAAVRAGAAIMKIHGHKDDYDITLKSDKTPITMADRSAHRTIREALGHTRIPILSEEGREMRYDERRNWELYWLVDPLDGTAEFIEGYNEFTVNIALMSEGVPVCAVVYVPYLAKAYVASQGVGSFLVEGVRPSSAADYTYELICSRRQSLPLASNRERNGFRVAVSRSHQTPETFERIEALREKYPSLEVIEQGSTYKFCLLAEGSIDYYPRTTHTYEWDTAAAELILSEAGGSTRSLPEGEPLRYNKADLRNPWFECYGAR
jgi:3'(2'), 5'-bisphosphate nucleotidase